MSDAACVTNDGRGPPRQLELADHLIVYLAVILDVFVALQALLGPGNLFDLVFFSTISILVPPFVAGIFLAAESGRTDEGVFRAAIVNSASIVILATSLTLSSAALARWAADPDVGAWQAFLLWSLTVGSALHFIWLAFLIGAKACSYQITSPVNQLICRVAAFRLHPLAVLAAASIGLLLSAEMNGTLPFVGSVISLFSELEPPAGLPATLISLLLGPIIVGAAVLMARRRSNSHAAANPRLAQTWLAIALLAVPLVYLDLRFNSDLLHFLTNAGPANQMLRSNGVPLVDAYSQYGLGPLIMTWLAFVLVKASLHSANLMAQFHSLALYCCILVCIFRMTEHKLAALLLGFFSISILLSGWWYGNHSLNSVPSSMGMRYLPCALIVLAMSLMGERQKASCFLVASTAIAMAWSSEMFVGAVAIVSLFISLEYVRSFDTTSLVRAVFWNLLAPFSLAVAMMCTGTLVATGQLPDFVPVLEFLYVYNMTSEFWAIASSGQFFGWLAVAGAVGAALSSSWYAALSHGLANLANGKKETSAHIEHGPDPAIATRRFAPMAGLAIVMSSYYVGRSVDFTLIIAFLPCAALFIPAFLALASTANLKQRSSVILTAIAACVVATFLAFSFVAVFRSEGPYRPLATEFARGSLRDARARFASQPMIDAIANPNYSDVSGLAAEALRAIGLFGRNQERITVLLGTHPTARWSVHSDMVLLLAGLGNTFPVSYVLSDELSPARMHQILSAHPQLENGALVLVRAERIHPGTAQAGILKIVRSRFRLSHQEFDGSLIDVYLITGTIF